MYSQRFDPVPQPSRDNSECYNYANPSNLRERARDIYIDNEADTHRVEEADEIGNTF